VLVRLDPRFPATSKHAVKEFLVSSPGDSPTQRNPADTFAGRIDLGLEHNSLCRGDYPRNRQTEQFSTISVTRKLIPNVEYTYVDKPSGSLATSFQNCGEPSLPIMSSPAPQHSISKKVLPESGTDAGEEGTELEGGL
jgi:hypothetical protein